MTLENLLITVAGKACAVNKNSTVNVRVGKSYIPMPASELKVGYEVLYLDESIDVQLELVDEILRKYVPRYSEAKYHLHFKKENNLFPIFQYYLWQGLAEKGHIASNPLITSENLSRYKDTAVDIIHDIGGIHVTKNAISLWLEGKVLAPRDMGQFKDLGEISDVFLNIFHSLDQEGGFKTHYDNYVIPRKIVMKHLSKIRSKEATNKWEAESSKSEPVSCKNEIEAVVNALLPYIEKRIYAFPIEEISAMKNGNQWKYDPADPRLHKGILTGIESPSTISMAEFIDDYLQIEALIFDKLSRRTSQVTNLFGMRNRIKKVGEAMMEKMFTYNFFVEYVENNHACAAFYHAFGNEYGKAKVSNLVENRMPKFLGKQRKFFHALELFTPKKMVLDYKKMGESYLKMGEYIPEDIKNWLKCAYAYEQIYLICGKKHKDLRQAKINMDEAAKTLRKNGYSIPGLYESARTGKVPIQLESILGKYRRYDEEKIYSVLNKYIEPKPDEMILDPVASFDRAWNLKAKIGGYIRSIFGSSNSSQSHLS